MRITVDRNINLAGNLVFTITVNELHKVDFGENEINLLKLLDVAKHSVEESPSDDEILKRQIISLIHCAKEKPYEKIIDSLKFSIKNDLQRYFEPICQEIYNCIYDVQEKPVKDWLQEFDPQRTKYYFSNDLKYDISKKVHELCDDKIDDEDDEDDDEDD